MLPFHRDPTNAGERGCGPPLGERGHAFRAVAASPDVVAVPVILDVAVQPRVVDAALGADPHDRPAHPVQQLLVAHLGRAVQVFQEVGAESGLLDGLSSRGQQYGVRAHIHRHVHGASQFQGAAEGGVQPEFQRRIERQTVGYGGAGGSHL